MSSINAKVTILPVELIRYIVGLLSPCEIVRLRQVSKQFRDISLDPLLWRDIYTRAPLPRPSGPFPWQSTLYLERTLAQSDLLSKTWVSQPAKLISHPAPRCNLYNATMWNLLLGRWCIWMEENNIYCRDINTGNSQMLYEGSFGDEEFLCETFPGTDRDGQRIYSILTDYGYPYRFLKLLELDVSSDSLSEPKTWDLLHLDPQLRTYRLANEEHPHHWYDPSPFLIIHAIYRPSMVLDLRTLGVYELPRFTGGGLDEFHLNALPTSEIWRCTMTLLVPTRTHVIAFQVVDLPHAVLVVIQAFVAPDSPRSRPFSELRLTHQVLFYDEERLADGTIAKPIFPISETSLLRNSVVDPVTQSINIKILYASQTLDPINIRVSFLDLTLPASSSPSSILPIHVRREHLFQSLWISRKFTASEDGYARGILVSYTEHPHQIAIRKFTIDAGGDMCTAQFGELSLMTDPPGIDWNDVVFDGVTGKLHYFHTAPYVHLTTFDMTGMYASEL